jgi:polar amino acid transport system substrate-binding protein
MKSLLLWVLCAIMLVSIGNTFATEITVVTEQYPPFNYEEAGEVKGISSEVVRTVLQKVGVNVKIGVYPWAQAYKMATTQPNVLIYSLARFPEREALFKWVGTIAPLDTYLYKLKSRKDLRIGQLRDITPYRVGVIRDAADHQYLVKQGFKNLVEASEYKLNLEKLKAGQVDLLVTQELWFIAMVKSLGLHLEDFEKAYHIDDLSGEFYMAFSKATPDELVLQFRQALAKVKAEGTYNKILRKYLAP